MESKTLKVAGLYAVAVAMPLLLLVSAAHWLHGSPLAMSIATVIAISAAMVLAGRAWHVSDETAHEAHKSAWFWGGSFGGLCGFIAFVIWMVATTDAKTRALDMMQLGHGAWPHQPLNLITIGAVGIVLAQVLGYGIAWATWWLRHR